jgi:hypothetical protein
MVIEWEGRAYTLDFAELDVEQAEAVEKITGMSLGDWLAEMGAGVRGLTFWKVQYWVMMAQAGERLPTEGLNFKVARFISAFAEAVRKESPAPVPEVPAAPDPTGAAVKPPARTSRASSTRTGGTPPGRQSRQEG